MYIILYIIYKSASFFRIIPQTSEGFKTTYPPTLVPHSKIKFSKSKLYFGVCGSPGPDHPPPPPSTLHAIMTTALSFSVVCIYFLCIFVFLVYFYVFG